MDDDPSQGLMDPATVMKRVVAKCLRCAIKAYAGAYRHPRAHKALIAGHVAALAAFGLGLMGHYEAEHLTGLGSSALLLHHILTMED